MQSIWYNEELQKAILGYRETIAALEYSKEHLPPGDGDDIWWEQAEDQILRLQQSIASLENFLGDGA